MPNSIHTKWNSLELFPFSVSIHVLAFFHKRELKGIQSVTRREHALRIVLWRGFRELTSKSELFLTFKLLIFIFSCYLFLAFMFHKLPIITIIIHSTKITLIQKYYLFFLYSKSTISLYLSKQSASYGRYQPRNRWRPRWHCSWLSLLSVINNQDTYHGIITLIKSNKNRKI